MPCFTSLESRLPSEWQQGGSRPAAGLLPESPVHRVCLASPPWVLMTASGPSASKALWGNLHPLIEYQKPSIILLRIWDILQSSQGFAYGFYSLLTRPHLTKRSGPVATSDKITFIVDLRIQVLCFALDTPTHFATVMRHECRLHWFYVFWNWRKYLIKPVNFYTDNKKCFYRY